MTYNPGIPLSNDLISQSQSQLLTNFGQLNMIFGLDHVEFNNPTAANRGKHTASTYVEQAVAPATAANEEALYSAAIGGTTRVFVRPPSSGAQYQLTAIPPSPGVTGYSYLPGGILIQWGGQSSTGPNPVTFPIAFSTVYQIIGITNANDRAFAVTILNNNNFTFSVLNPIAAVTIRWVAIGAE